MSDVNKIIEDITIADEGEILEFDFIPCFTLMLKMESELNEAKREAEDLANIMYKKYYANDTDAVPFELCDSVAGVITQIDNMVAGLVRSI